MILYIESIIGLFKNECNDHYYIITILNSARFVRRKRIIGWCLIHKYDESDEKGQRKGRCRNIPAVNRYRCLLGIYKTAGLRSDIYHIDIYCHLYIPIQATAYRVLSNWIPSTVLYRFFFPEENNSHHQWPRLINFVDKHTFSDWKILITGIPTATKY